MVVDDEGTLSFEGKEVGRTATDWSPRSLPPRTQRVSSQGTSTPACSMTMGC